MARQPPQIHTLRHRRTKVLRLKKNRFAWLIDDEEKYPLGKVLLVEDIDRFSCMEVEDGKRELLAIFDRGS